MAEPVPGDALQAAFSELAGGDLGALDRVYDLSASAIFGLALWRTGSRDDAADVVQDVFVRLAQTRADLRRVKNPRAYLLGMTHRAAVDVLRKRRRTVELDETLQAPAGSGLEAAADAARVSSLLGALPAAQREAVYLRHFTELSFAEIGDATGVPTFTAASRYRLGLGRLRRLLGVKP